MSLAEGGGELSPFFVPLTRSHAAPPPPPKTLHTTCRTPSVKTDACGGRGWNQDNVTWIDFRAGITRCSADGGRPMVLSVESCNDPRPGGCSEWIGALANLWRTTGDIQATFESMMGNLDGNNNMANFSGPGRWNDRALAAARPPTHPGSRARTLT